MPTSIRARRRARSSTDFKGEKLDYWVTGYGTGGTLKGVSRVLAKEMPDTKIVVCEPEDAQLLGSGVEQARNPDGSPAAPHPAFKPHPMQGWTPDFIPKLTADAVADEGHRPHHPDPRRRGDAHAAASSRSKEGIFVGITAGATFAGALRVCAEAPKGANILCMLPDTGERYLEHAAVRQRAGGHDAGGAGDLALDAERAVPGLTANSKPRLAGAPEASSAAVTARRLRVPRIGRRGETDAEARASSRAAAAARRCCRRAPSR